MSIENDENLNKFRTVNAKTARYTGIHRAEMHSFEGEIAKSLSFIVNDIPILVIVAGDKKIDNHKFKEEFNIKAKMLPFDDVETLIGHAAGGVCPFGVNPEVKTYLDISLKRFETVFPAAGSGNSAIELTIPELEKYSNFVEWIDVCKDWE